MTLPLGSAPKLAASLVSTIQLEADWALVSHTTARAEPAGSYPNSATDCSPNHTVEGLKCFPASSDRSRDGAALPMVLTLPAASNTDHSPSHRCWFYAQRAAQRPARTTAATSEIGRKRLTWIPNVWKHFDLAMSWKCLSVYVGELAIW